MARAVLLLEALDVEARRIESRNTARLRRSLRDEANALNLTDAEFKAHYRLTKELFQGLCNEIRPFMAQTRRRTKVSVECKVLTALSFYATGSYQKPVGMSYLHGLSQASVSIAVKEVTFALNTLSILTKYIRFPQSQQERNTIINGFSNKFGFPGCIGCIDCTHVALVQPTEHAERFFNRKHYHSRNVQIDNTMNFESRIETLTQENRELTEALENERTLVKMLREKVDKSNLLCDESKAEVNHLNSMVTDMQHDFLDIQRKFDKEKREKDEALLRNAHMSQTIEMSQCNVRYHEGEIVELKSKITELEGLIAQHKENQAACMLIKETEEARKQEIEQLKKKIDELIDNETALKKTIQDLETEICDKNKKMKTLDNRISDMKKTLQRELQSSKSDLTSAEEQDISRRYLKHVVLRFLTARELEARQLTRALAALLRLSAHEEALLRAALPPRTGLAAWFPSLNT